MFTHYSIDKSEIDVYEDYESIESNLFDYIFITSKTTANEEIAENLNNNRRILKENAKIIIFQNGFGNDEAFLKHFPKDMVFSARLITGFRRPERHISEVTVYTEPILLGSLQHEDPNCLKKLPI